jgi:hypothetical protein
VLPPHAPERSDEFLRSAELLDPAFDPSRSEPPARAPTVLRSVSTEAICVTLVLPSLWGGVSELDVCILVLSVTAVGAASSARLTPGLCDRESRITPSCRFAVIARCWAPFTVGVAVHSVESDDSYDMSSARSMTRL